MPRSGDLRRRTAGPAARAGSVATLLVVLAILSPATGCGGPGETSATPGGALRTTTLTDALAAARPGDTVVLPAGTYRGGEIVPPGVALRGAGMDRTLIDARGLHFGLRLAGGRGSAVSDLTVRGASKVGVLAQGGEDVALRRLRATGSEVGVVLSDVDRGRVENAVVDDNRQGVVIQGGRGLVVVNCTMASNAEVGLSLAGVEGCSAFNNGFAGGAVGVAIGGSSPGLRLDHNVYGSARPGQVPDRPAPRTLAGWRSASGQDARSVQLPVAFRGPTSGDFRPEGALPWALDRSATTDWGASELAGVAAPARDAAEAPRVGAFDAGAYEAAPEPARPPDGLVTIRGDAGTKSAGLFAPGGRQVADLFQDLPLASGVYPFWLPPRDVQGRAIAAGTYELKTVEGQLRWEYLGRFGEGRDPSGSTGGGLASAFDEPGRYFNASGKGSFRLDESTGRWSGEAAWVLPVSGEFLGTFSDGGRTFGALVLRDETRPGGALLVVEYHGTSARPVLLVGRDAKTGRVLGRTDTNRDGRLDARDATVDRPGPPGVDLSGDADLFPKGGTILQPGGDVLSLNVPPGAWALVWRRAGLDADGVPAYPAEKLRAIPRPRAGLFSPYARRPDPTDGLAGAVLAEGGGLVALVRMTTAPGGLPRPGIGTDLVGLDDEGRARWFRPLAPLGGLTGPGSVGPIALASVVDTGEVLAFDRDGLGLGGFGPPPSLEFGPPPNGKVGAVHAYRGRDGRAYAVVDDREGGVHHWWRLVGEETLATAATAFSLSSDAARALVAPPSGGARRGGSHR